MVSMILTVMNEESSVGTLVDDVLTQSRKPDELVVVDGGSRDGTIAAIEARRSKLQGGGIRLELIIEPGANIAEGRNIAVRAAAHDVICASDAGCRLDRDWVREVTAPLLAGEAGLVGGFYKPVHHTQFQRVLAGLTVAKTPPRGFMPSSRSIAFTRSAWQAAGGYPEWLMWGEDTLFNELCIKAGARYVVAESAIVHWEVRRTPRAAMRQFYRYALGDGQRRRVTPSFLANTFAVVMSLGLYPLSPFSLLLFPVYVAAVTAGATRRLEPADLPWAWVLAMGLRVARAVGWVRGLVESRTAEQGREARC